MNTLLKDLPEFAERIENNFSLKQLIKDVLEDNEQALFDKSEEGNKIELTEINALSSDDYETATSEILEKISEFINDNYHFKGDKKLMEVIIK